MLSRSALVLGVGVVISVASGACAAKAAPLASITVCGRSVAIPDVLPPTGSGPVVLMAAPCLEPKDGGAPTIPAAFQRYVQLQVSRPSDNLWVPYNDRTQQTMDADYRRLWETGRLSDLSISVTDYAFPNGVIGKIVTYVLREGTTQPSSGA